MMGKREEHLAFCPNKTYSMNSRNLIILRAKACVVLRRKWYLLICPQKCRGKLGAMLEINYNYVQCTLDQL